MWKENLEKVRLEEKTYGEELNSGVSDKEADKFKKAVKKKFKMTLPDAYLEMLKTINGLEYNGVILYGVDQELLKQAPVRHVNGLIENNENWQEDEWDKPYLFLGERDISFYVFDTDGGKYYELDNPSGDVTEEFEDFETMFDSMLESMLS